MVPSKKLCSTAADAAATPNSSHVDLNKDVLVEILSRLPTKRLLKFMSVSKSWHELISTIISSRRNIIRPMSGLFLQWTHYHGVLYSCKLRDEFFHHIKTGAPTDDITIEDASLSFLPCYPDFRILDCRGGLLLCSPKRMLKDWEMYYLCNPLTKKWIHLPKARVSRFCPTAALVFESPDSLHYKVFRFFNPLSKHDRHIYAEVYSSRSREWEECEMALDFPIKSICEQRAVFLEGALYLAACNHLAVRVEVKEEQCRVIKLPNYSPKRPIYPNPERLGVCNGRLHYACRDRTWLQIWMLDGGSGSCEWVLKHSTSIRDLLCSLISAFTVLAFHPEKDLIYARIRCNVVSIHFHQGIRSYNDLYDIRSEDVDALWFWVYPFAESLHPPFAESLHPLAVDK